MDNKEILKNYEKAIIEIYHEKKLTCLRGLNQDFIHQGIQIMQYYYAIEARIRKSNKSDFDYKAIFDELVFLSDEIMYFTAILYFNRPYINNPLENKIVSGDKTYYPNMQNMFAKRYNMYLDMVYQCLYNYWDRIGDILASIFPHSIKEHDVIFTRALDVVPDSLKESDNYKWLADFKNNEYREFNSKRKSIVHYVTINTEFTNAHLENIDNKDKISELMAERENYPDYFNNQIIFIIEGLIKSLNLVAEYIN
ncbi:MAG: Cthe_2314 family HEPN domain-containing protein [Ignavibacteria bacterium]|nr:Cthe_2314 family HEPN domain-containing protein [Ignavibacteria bacterium]